MGELIAHLDRLRRAGKPTDLAVSGGVGELKALMYWAPGGYSETRSRFARDPLNLAGGADSTCTEDSPASPGAQFRAKAWGIFVHVGTPLALMVRHDGPSPVG